MLTQISISVSNLKSQSYLNGGSYEHLQEQRGPQTEKVTRARTECGLMRARSASHGWSRRAGPAARQHKTITMRLNLSGPLLESLTGKR
jgi:hypothetical protein